MKTRLHTLSKHLTTTRSLTTPATTTRRPITTTKMATTHLAILDDYADVAPKHFKHIPNLQLDSFPSTLDPSTPAGLEALAKRLEPYPIVSCMRERTAFPAELIQKLPNLKLLLSSGNRNAALDLEALKERGVPVTGTKGDIPAKPSGEFDAPPPPGYSAVNQHAWALLLSLCGRIPQDDRLLKTDAGAWQNGLGVSLGGKTLGLVGLGKLGTAMAKVGVLGFGMKVVAWSENLTPEKADDAARGAGLETGTFKAVSKEELFKTADVVSLHLVLSGRSRGVVGARELGWMKRSGLLLNTSRGGLIDEEALIEALKEGGIKGVALDVFWQEPIPKESPWRSVDSWAKSEVVLSPHMGYVNEGTMNRWYQEQAEELERWLKGEELQNKMA